MELYLINVGVKACKGSQLNLISLLLTLNAKAACGSLESHKAMNRAAINSG